MAWTLDGTTITIYGLEPGGDIGTGTATIITASPILQGGSRTSIVQGKKRWVFSLRWVATATAQTIEDSLAKTSFTFYDDYASASYTVHCVGFSGFRSYDSTKSYWFCTSIVLEVA